MRYTTFRNTLLSVGVLAVMGSVAYVTTRRPSANPAPPKPPAQLAQTQSTPAQAAVPVPSAAQPDYVDYLLNTLGKPAPDEKHKDALGSGKPHVNLYAERGMWIRAKVDLDRDEKWDEKWHLREDGTVEREVAPADDENYSDRFLFKDGTWAHK